MFNKILCPVELRNEPKKLLETLADLCSKFNSSITLLHISEDFLNKDEMVMSRVSVKSVMDENKEYAIKQRDLMGKLLLKYNFSADIVIHSGKAAEEIVKFSNNGGFDLIVIGDNGRHRITDYLMGSTSFRVVNSVDCSVLVVSNR